MQFSELSVALNPTRSLAKWRASSMIGMVNTPVMKPVELESVQNQQDSHEKH
jgi:hypothetical protein